MRSAMTTDLAGAAVIPRASCRSTPSRRISPTSPRRRRAAARPPGQRSPSPRFRRGGAGLRRNADLSLNDGGAATCDAAASALLGDQSKLVFDYVVSASDTPTVSLAITRTQHAGRGGDRSRRQPRRSRCRLARLRCARDQPEQSRLRGGNANVLPAFTINGFTRPELHLDATGHIELDGAAAALAAQYGLEYLYLGGAAGNALSARRSD